MTPYRVRFDEATADGTVRSSARGAPTRIPAELARFFPTVGADLRGPPPRCPGAAPGRATASNSRSAPDLDRMDHVNNGVYVDFVEEAVPAAGGGEDLGSRPRCTRLEYLLPVTIGDAIEAVAWRTPESWAIRLVRHDGADVVRARIEARQVEGHRHS